MLCAIGRRMPVNFFTGAKKPGNFWQERLVNMLKVKIKGQYLKKILTKKSLSRQDFAKMIGMAPNYLGDVMMGLRNAGPKARTKILDALPGVEYLRV